MGERKEKAERLKVNLFLLLVQIAASALHTARSLLYSYIMLQKKLTKLTKGSVGVPYSRVSKNKS